MRGKIETMTKYNAFFEGTYWDYCIRTIPDCFHIFPDGEVDVDFDKLNEKRDIFRWDVIGSAECAESTSLEIVHTILKNVLFAGIWPEYIVRLEKGELERLRTHRLVMDEAPNEFDSSVRRPYYRMRGKPVTEEQAFDVIRKTDMHIGFNLPRSHSHQLVHSCHFKNWWFDPGHVRYGWIHPNGMVGINSITDKYPTFLELLSELLDYQKAFPFLDFAAAITWWDEKPYYKLSGDKEQQDEVSRQYPDFLENVEFGIHLDGKTIEFLGRDRAIAAYQKYEALYDSPNISTYIPELNASHFYNAEAYFQRCLAAFKRDKD